MTMMKTQTTLFALVAAAGLAISAPAIAATQSQDSGNRTQERSQSQQRAYVFDSANNVLDTTLKNRQGDELGTIDDLVVDRGTGRIEAVVISEGGFLGFGGTQVAIPFDAFFLNSNTKALNLNASEAMFEDEDRTLPDGWQRLEDGWEKDLSTLASSDWASRQRIPATDKDTETKSMSGTITAVDRVDFEGGHHWMAIRIGEAGEGDRENDGGEGRYANGEFAKDGNWVVLGPAWYATGAMAAPVRGQRVEVEAFDGHEGMTYAKRATFDGEEVRYRDERFEPMWTNRMMRSDSQRNPGPMVLLTDVLDENVIWGRSDDEVGEVTDAVLELTTGHVSVLAIDPDGDWWGQDVGPRGVPFDIARIGRDAITLDATRSMLGGAEVLPEDLRSMTMPRTREAVFVVFEVSPPVYNR